MNASTRKAPQGAGDAQDSCAPVAPSCRDAAGRALLVPYACSSCTDEEALTFEAHMLTCAACFEDLKVLDRAGVVIREFTSTRSEPLERLLERRRANEAKKA